MRKYCNYHIHSDESNIFFTDSPVKKQDYAKRAVELKHTILSSCEHGFAGNFLNTYSIAEKYGLKFVFAAELYWVKDRYDKDKTNNHIVLIAKTEAGRRQINRLISTANDSGFYMRPRADIPLLLSLNPKDVMVTSACVGFYGYGMQESEQIILRLASHFGSSFYIEVQAHPIEEQRAVNCLAMKLYRSHGISLIAGVDSHFIKPEEAYNRECMQLGINNQKDEDSEGTLYMDYPDGDELFTRFKEQGVLPDALIEDAISNTNIVETFETFSFDKTRKIPNPYPELTKEQRDEKYLALVKEKWDEFKKDIDPSLYPKYEEAIKYETDTVVEGGISDYFLLDYELVRRGVEKGGIITRSGRGSGASFFTNTLLGFSTMDRIALPVKMFPDRFVSKPRLLTGQLPDLDLNVADRAPFIEAQKDIVGAEHCFPMIAYGCMKKKSAWKMYCRVVNKESPGSIDNDTMQIISDALGDYDMAAKDAEDDEDVDITDYVPEKYMPLYEKSEEYGGIIQGKTVHPCAVLVYSGNIREEIGLIRAISETGKSNELVTPIDGVTADKFGYVKNDILVVRAWDLIDRIYKEIGMPIPTTNQLLKLVTDDKPTWDVFANGYCLGVNQCEREKTKARLMRYKPTNFTELSAFVAAIRPGFKSNLETFISRKPFTYNIPEFDALIQTPQMRSSFILYQENIMAALQYAGFEPTETYAVLKHIAKKHPEEIAKIKPRFIKGFDESSMRFFEGESAGEMVWQIINDASSYSFNACLAGSERIDRLRGKNSFSPTIEEMYKIKNDRYYAIRTGHRGLNDKYKYGYGYALSMFDDGRLHKNKIIDIRFAGFRTVYLVTLEDGKTIRCTDNHRFPTPHGDKMLSDLSVGDELYIKGEYEKNRDVHRFTTDESLMSNIPVKGLPVDTVKIASIVEDGMENTYDVEMAAPAHNFVVESGIITHNSHSAAVAFDALYVAWAKAHYPAQTFYAMFKSYDDGKKKKKLAQIKSEMWVGYKIKINPPKFGFDNSDFSRVGNTINDSLTGIPYMNRAASSKLAELGKNMPKTWVDFLLVNADMKCLDARQMNILINIGYFDCYGSAKALSEIYNEFRDGKFKYDTKYKDATKQKRIEALNTLQLNTSMGHDTPYEQASRQTVMLGCPLGVFDVDASSYVVTEINEKYSPKLTLFALARGTSGTLKMRKDWYNNNPIAVGDCIRIRRSQWEPRPKYSYTDGKREIIPGEKENWITGFEKLYSVKRENAND